eukprot:432024_1
MILFVVFSFLVTVTLCEYNVYQPDTNFPGEPECTQTRLGYTTAYGEFRYCRTGCVWDLGSQCPSNFKEIAWSRKGISGGCSPGWSNYKCERYIAYPTPSPTYEPYGFSPGGKAAAVPQKMDSVNNITSTRLNVIIIAIGLISLILCVYNICCIYKISATKNIKNEDA